MQLIFDGHLDLAMQALVYERDQRLTVAEIRGRERADNPSERGRCTLSFDELRAARAGVVVSTIFIRCKPGVDPNRVILREDADYPCPTMAHANGQMQVSYYKLMEELGELRFITSKGELATHLELWEESDDPVKDKLPIGMIMMMEGADPIYRVDQTAGWYEQGLRCISLAHFGNSRFGCGTTTASEGDGPLTELGKELLVEMDRLGIVLDLSHLSDMSIAEATEIYQGPLIATHSNCRRIADTSRQMTDVQIKKVIDRGGVVGAVLCVSMIRGDFDRKMPHDVSIRELADHVVRVCDLAGNTDHVGFGTDMDGGFGADWIPTEVDTYRDLQKFAEVLSGRGFSDEDIAKFYHENWSRFWLKHLPG
ncbi:Membrane dipeptidase (Peptidase family M19) [Poriferisphaera corsica]|uniref:Membrane dipeptidase (Peptidase family M19) n=1 Tax=Poriferisphaera corsica TaxID=2528020 RepID=A0A517YVU3_9BACT|nr:membrane dipeptidase [Poriferisphaera corsica]QDU34346.1 Membrane dipeptidase (Peptidase family M19) [Poriferisphaera corsica]